MGDIVGVELVRARTRNGVKRDEWQVTIPIPPSELLNLLLGLRRIVINAAGGVGELDGAMVAIHALPGIGIDVLRNDCLQIGMRLGCCEPLGRAVVGTAVHGDLAVAPRLPADPVDAVVAVPRVVEETVVHALGAFRAEVSTGRLTDEDVTGIEEAAGDTAPEVGVVAADEHDRVSAEPRPADARAQLDPVPHGHHQFFGRRPVDGNAMDCERECGHGCRGLKRVQGVFLLDTTGGIVISSGRGYCIAGGVRKQTKRDHSWRFHIRWRLLHHVASSSDRNRIPTDLLVRGTFRGTARQWIYTLRDERLELDLHRFFSPGRFFSLFR